MLTRVWPQAGTVVGLVLYKSYPAAIAEPQVGIRASSKWRLMRSTVDLSGSLAGELGDCTWSRGAMSEGTDLADIMIMTSSYSWM